MLGALKPVLGKQINSKWPKAWFKCKISSQHGISKYAKTKYIKNLFTDKLSWLPYWSQFIRSMRKCWTNKNNKMSTYQDGTTLAVVLVRGVKSCCGCNGVVKEKGVHLHEERRGEGTILINEECYAPHVSMGYECGEVPIVGGWSWCVTWVATKGCLVVFHPTGGAGCIYLGFC